MTTAAETARRCTQCGAMPARHAARFCEYCGAELPRLPAPQPAPSGSPMGDVAARFAAVEGSRRLEELLRAEPNVPNPMGGARLLVSTLGLVVVAAVGLFFTIAMAAVFPPMALVPVAIVAIVVFLIVSQWIKSARFERLRLVRECAMVLSTRTKVSGGGNERSAKTQYFVTLQLPDGTRRELEALEHVIGTIAPGDLGVAYTKGTYLVEFGRLPA